MTAQTTITTTTTMQIRGGALLDALTTTRPALQRQKKADPSQRCVHLTAGAKSGARLECHTGGTSMSVDLEKATGTADVWVDAQDLQRAVATQAARTGPRSKIELELTLTDDSVTVTGPAGETRVTTADPEQMMPALNPVETALITDRETFVGHITTAAACADSSVMAPPILTGIHLAAGQIVCTDRYQLAAVDFPAAGTLPEVNVPARIFAQILKKTHGKTLDMGTDGERISVRTDGMTWTMRCLTGDYPKVTSIHQGLTTGGIPQVNLKRTMMIDLLKPYARGNHTVILTPADGHLEVTVRDTAADGPLVTATVPMPTGDDLDHQVAFNAGRLLNILKTLDGDCVTMRNPGPLKPAGFVGSHRHRLIILQPVRRAS